MPNGTTLVYVGESDGVSRLFARRLDSFDIRPLQGTEGAIHPFFSPDGESVGFLTNDQLKIVGLNGGVPRVLGGVSRPVVGTWAQNGWIYVGDNESRELVRVSVDGGVREEIVSGLDPFGAVLPSGEHAFATRFTGSGSADYAEIHIVSLPSGESRPLIQNGYDARYASPGYVLFGRAGDLFAVPFQLDRLEVQGEPVRVASNVRMDGIFANVQAAVSETGVVVYAPGGDSARGKLAWIDRNGRTEFLPVAERNYGSVDLAPDGRRVAVDVLDVRDYILIYEAGQGETLIQGPAHQKSPLWARSENKIAHTRRESREHYEILVQVPNSGRPPEVLAAGEDPNWVGAAVWMPQDSQVVVATWPEIDLFLAPGQGSEPLPAGLAGTAGYDTFVDLDSSGEWMAVHTGSSVEVRSLDGEHSYQVSAGFGTEPRWCAACDELFYRTGNQIFSVSTRTASGFDWDPSQLVFEVEGFIDTDGWSYDVSPDGQQLIVVKRERVLPRDRIRVVTDWTSVFEGPVSE